MTPVRVPMAALDLQSVRAQAARGTSEMMLGRPAYGRTSLDMNLVGSLGEAAVEHWLTGWCSFVKNVADAPGGIPLGQGDILFRFPTARDFDAQEYVEVKTSRRRDGSRSPNST